MPDEFDDEFDDAEEVDICDYCGGDGECTPDCPRIDLDEDDDEGSDEQ